MTNEEFERELSAVSARMMSKVKMAVRAEIASALAEVMVELDKIQPNSKIAGAIARVVQKSQDELEKFLLTEILTSETCGHCKGAAS